MINRGEFKMYPREVEGVMMKHSAVSITSLIGIPD